MQKTVSMFKNSYRNYVPLIIPVLYLIWSLQVNLWGGSVSLSRSDPEYPYLLNGLNCATLSFDNIGHTDHPGTPFQLVTGVFLRTTHFIIGQGDIVEDVLSRPETYLSVASFFLSVLTFFLLLLLGRIALRRDIPIIGSLILQSSFLLSSVLIDFPLRYNPDRMLVLINLGLAAMIIQFLFSTKYSVKRFAILAGLLMGVGFATKFNYLPVLIIPLMLIPDYRHKIYYGLSVAAAFFVSVLPIFNKFKDFRRFLSDVASHDGLYGQGTQQIINWRSFGHNFTELLSSSPAFTVILILSIGLILFFLFNKSKRGSSEQMILILKAFVYASIIGFILVSKHFKVYYFAPVLSLGGLVLFVIWRISRDHIHPVRVHTLAFSLLLVVLVGLSVLSLPGQYRSRIAQKNANLKTSRFYQENVSRDDLLLIEPTWLAGPIVENALVYGISYVAHRHEFYKTYNKLYPNILTWEGFDKPLRLFRTADADPESILLSGRDIFVYSSPGRSAGNLLDYLDTLASRFGTRFIRDTAFRNPDNSDLVIRAFNPDRWSTISNRQYFQEPVTLTEKGPVSESVWITDVRSGDYIEITVTIRHNDPDAACRLIARSSNFDQDGLYFEDSGSLQNIGDGWQLLRLRCKIGTTPASGKLECQAYYPGTRSITIEGLQIRHLGQR